VLATPATFQGALYASVVERFASGVEVMQDTCPGLVAQIEAGRSDSPETRRILQSALRPMLAQGIDTVVLGCTHYPFVIPLIQEIAGPGVRVIDPAPAIARQTRRVLERRDAFNQASKPRVVVYTTSGSPHKLQGFIQQVLGKKEVCTPALWTDDGRIIDGQPA
jgi:glutamate racemase